MKRLKTKRLVIELLSDEQMQEVINMQTEEHLITAYTYMLEQCKKDPKQRQWNALSAIRIKSSMEAIGYLSFMGAPVNGTVEIGYGIDPQYQRQGYGKEAVNAAVLGAFADSSVYFVQARVEYHTQAELDYVMQESKVGDVDNDVHTIQEQELHRDSIGAYKLLMKSGFQQVAIEKEDLSEERQDGTAENAVTVITYERAKESVSYLSMYMCFGVAIGTALGNMANSMAYGMCIGVALGVAFGMLIQRSEDKKRAAMIAQKNQFYGNCK